MSNRRSRKADPGGELLGSYIRTVDERLLALAAVEVARATGTPHLTCLTAIRAAWESPDFAELPVVAETWLKLIATTIAAVAAADPARLLARAVTGESAPWRLGDYE